MKTENKFCAFIDVLGFKKIIEKWDIAENYYKTLVMKIFPFASSLLGNIRKTSLKFEDNENSNQYPFDLTWRIFSDSIIVMSSNPLDLVQTAGNVQYYSFMNGYWTRGGFAFGRHKELSQGPNFFVVSEALSAAYTTESEISKDPRIVIHNSAIEGIEKAFYNRGGDKLMPIESNWLVQSSDDLWFINPFIFRPVDDIVLFVENIEKRILQHKDTEYINKYLWVGDLHNFITSHKMLMEKENWNSYYGNSDEYSNKLKEINIKQSQKIFVNTWDYSKEFYNFFLPRIEPFSPFGSNKELLIADSPYRLNYKENVANWNN
jgi:hypothetical protein